MPTHRTSSAYARLEAGNSRCFGFVFRHQTPVTIPTVFTGGCSRSPKNYQFEAIGPTAMIATHTYSRVQQSAYLDLRMDGYAQVQCHSNWATLVFTMTSRGWTSIRSLVQLAIWMCGSDKRCNPYQQAFTGWHDPHFDKTECTCWYSVSTVEGVPCLDVLNGVMEVAQV